MFAKSKMKYDVFFCYARKDLPEAKLINGILSNAGYTSFLDIESLLPGVNFVDTIQKHLLECKAIICIVSKNAYASEFFIKEVSYARSIGKYIIPIKIDDTPLDDRLYPLLGNIQFIYWEKESGEKLVHSLNHHISLLNADNVIAPRAEVEIADEIQMLDNYIPQKVDYDIFISYRREGGRDCARTIQLQLQQLGYERIFFDYSSIRDGVFNTQILDAIYSCKDFLLLLSPNSMDRCINRGDWVAREIRTAFKYERKIIPITMQDNFEWPNNCPNDLKSIQNLQYHKLLVDEYFRDSVKRLSKRLSITNDNKQSTISRQVYYYKIISNTKCKVYIDDNDCIIVEKDEFKKFPLQKGEYFVKIVDYDTNQELIRKVVSIDGGDKVENIT